jgi:acid phosphatase (class A)
MTLIRSGQALALVLISLALVYTAFGANFVAPEQVDLHKLLVPPPADASSHTKAEIDELLSIQRDRTREAAAEAATDAADRSIFRLGYMLGAGFTRERLPIVASFFERLGEDGMNVVDQAKRTWSRSRPFELNADIRPCCVVQSGSVSYPSGHAALGYLNAIVLGNMIPEKREAIFERAAQYGANRMVCGVHYSSDVEAGRISGTVIAAFAMQNPAFQQEFNKARDELRKALGYSQ